MAGVRNRDDPHLFAKLEATMPDPLVVGKGNALFVSGWCFHTERRITKLAIRADGSEHRISAHSMPRADVFAAYDRETDPHGHRYRSGFWAILPFPSANSHERAELELVATLATGEVVTKPVASVAVKPSPELGDGGFRGPVGQREGEPLIAIAMTTYNPRLELLRAQLDSLREQSHRNWVCVVSDDQSRPDLYARVRAELDGDDRFALSQTGERLGYYRNFERVLGLVPHEAELVAMCDQDDRWHRDKLESLRAALDPDATLAYSDMNIVDEEGTVVSPTYWTDRRTNHTSMTSLLVANTITAAASLFPRRLLDAALPFPAPLGHAFHDHWLALVALATGRIAYVDRPLYDYVQHSANAFGTRSASWERLRAPRSERPPERVSARSRLSARLLRWRLDYFYNACPARLHAEILMMRCGDELSGGRRRAVKRMTRADSSLVLAARLGLRSIAARSRRSPTMGQERLIARGILWRRFVEWQGAFRRKGRESHGQALPTPPPPSAVAAPADAPRIVRQITRKIAPLPIRVKDTCEPKVNMLVPTIDLDHFFGAYIGKFNLARRLAEHGLRVRIVAVDSTRLTETWRDRIRRYEGLGSLLDKVEIEFAPERELLRLEVSPRDTFVATTSWTAHLAHRATQEMKRDRFIFVIQEYDPLTYPVGTFGAITRQAYTFPHFAVFSTEFLRDYFRNHRLGVFADGGAQGEERSVAFRNAITSVDPPSAEHMRQQPNSLLFYARPEAHAERNMFELGLMAMAEAIQGGVLERPWHLYGIGAMERSSVEIAHGTSMEILPRQSQDEYRSLLREHSIGLSLMDTPHPSLVPLEMASAGMLVVTSTFENKTADSLRSISENLIPVEPTVEGISGGLAEAVAAAGEVERRLRGSRVDWSRSWQESFDDRLVERIKSFVEAA